MYDIERLSDRVNGWAVINTATGLPATLNDVPQFGLSLEDADDLADLLNLIEANQPAKENMH